jgi:hypothetical protein
MAQQRRDQTRAAVAAREDWGRGLEGRGTRDEGRGTRTGATGPPLSLSPAVAPWLPNQSPRTKSASRLEGLGAASPLALDWLRSGWKLTMLVLPLLLVLLLLLLLPLPPFSSLPLPPARGLPLLPLPPLLPLAGPCLPLLRFRPLA